MLIRRRMMAAVKSLPYDAEIEYLQGNGSQYIDTGYIPNANTELEISYIVTKLQSQLSNPLTPFGCRVGWANKQYYVFSPVNNYNQCYLCYGNQNYTFSYNVLNSKITVHISSNVIDFDYVSRQFNSGNLPNLPIFLFGLNNNGSLFGVNGLELNIEYFWIKENGKYIIDYLPVRVEQVGYMYDKVSGQLFGNSGTDDFILGNDV